MSNFIPIRYELMAPKEFLKRVATTTTKTTTRTR